MKTAGELNRLHAICMMSCTTGPQNQRLMVFMTKWPGAARRVCRPHSAEEIYESTSEISPRCISWNNCAMEEGADRKSVV